MENRLGKPQVRQWADEVIEAYDQLHGMAAEPQVNAREFPELTAEYLDHLLRTARRPLPHQLSGTSLRSTTQIDGLPQGAID